MTDLPDDKTEDKKSWDRPEGASFDDWMNTRIARFQTRRLDEPDERADPPLPRGRRAAVRPGPRRPRAPPPCPPRHAGS